MENKLFESERIISQSGDKSITLTNYRIQHFTQSFGKSHYMSIHLQDVSSIEVHYRSFILFLVIGILGTTAAFYFGAMNLGDLFVLSGIIGLLFILIYFLTRKHVVTIASNGGGKVQFFTKGMKKETLFDFIHQIEKAKNMRLLCLNN
jgi:hypothetical protein